MRYHRIFLRELGTNVAALARHFANIHTLAYTPSYAQCLQLASDHLPDLPDGGTTELSYLGYF